jgi:hypothetical protein
MAIDRAGPPLGPNPACVMGVIVAAATSTASTGAPIGGTIRTHRQTRLLGTI